MSSFWATDDGWPYADTPDEVVEVDAEADDDRLSFESSRHLYDNLDPLEREVISARYGVGGKPVLSMKQLQLSTGLNRADLRDALVSGLTKLRTNLGVEPPLNRKA